MERGNPPVRLMGIVNVTPDSFSGDGTLAGRGLAAGQAAAIAQGLELAAAGADLLDVGGESTRPGHTPVGEEEELRRVLPVVRALAEQGLVVSIDTWKATVAARALEAGARVVNDIWGLRRAPAIAALAAEHGAELVVMHNQAGTVYAGDLLDEIAARLHEAVATAVRAGVPRERVIIDPGIGFGKTGEQNVVVLRRLAELRALGQPLLVGASRKGFLERLFGQPMERRAWGTAAIVAASVLRGATIVRVHDVAAMSDVVRVAAALRD
jgi:dihydropteroate synthase